MGVFDKQVGGDHYKGFRIQPFEFCQVNNLNGGESSVIRYTCRHRNKNGKEDLLKAIHILQMIIQLEYSEDA